jgi:hypothetical protein
LLPSFLSPKQLLQKTGLPFVGLKGTWQLEPQSAQVAVNISLSSELDGLSKFLPSGLKSEFLLFSKQLEQYTGLSLVGLKGISQSFPHLPQTA